MANTVEFGLTNVYIAKATKAVDGTVSYGTPARLYGAVNLEISSDNSGNDNVFYADNIATIVGTYLKIDRSVKSCRSAV